MRLNISDGNIPGTVLEREKMQGATGGELLDRIFYISDGIMLSQVRDISGVDGTTLQNWVKRGWVENPTNKMYSKDQLARILIINMMRSSIQLGKISFLLEYINGDTEKHDDDIVPESQLYDYICKIIDVLAGKSDDMTNGEIVRAAIEDVTAGYVENIVGARERLCSSLEVIIMSYYASLVTRYADGLVNRMNNGVYRNRRKL